MKDDINKYHVTNIDYRDIYGNLLWSSPMIFSRLHAIGEKFINDHKHYQVARVSIADNTQHVNIRMKTEDAPQNTKEAVENIA